MAATLTFHDRDEDLDTPEVLLIIGRKDRLEQDDVSARLPKTLPDGAWEEMLRIAEPGDNGRYAATYTGSTPRRVVVGVLPEHCSRHNTASRSWAIPGLVRSAGRGNVRVLLALSDADHAFASAMGVARALPTYTARKPPPERRYEVQFLTPDGSNVPLDAMRAGAAAVRRAGHLVDMPPDELGPDAFVAEARAVAKRTGATIMVVRGEELRQQGLGAIWGVGRAARQPPAMVVLDHAPEGATKAAAWVGKGICYDTGGLSIKPKTGMPGMKTDMGGAAAVLCAFEAAVQLGHSERLTAVLCIAENAVGPDAIRPDDILRPYSGRSIEVNNTDAEGRLVLADGLAWVTDHREPDEIVDLATLTGAQAMATGSKHAALYANADAIEARAIASGKRTGDLCFPIPYVPEFFRNEFKSQVADMKNSVKNRRNAQSSCAGQFLNNHLGKHTGAWLHVDMAAPSTSAGRGTGYGVGLLLGMAGLV